MVEVITKFLRYEDHPVEAIGHGYEKCAPSPVTGQCGAAWPPIFWQGLPSAPTLRVPFKTLM